MRQHPISPVTEPMQYRAIGVVRGCYVPADPDQPTRGLIRTTDGTEIEAVVLGRLLTLMRRHLDLAMPHLWVVYPRSREENQLHLQMVGVWEPSTLAPAPEAEANEAEATEAEATDADQLPEGDDYFSIRGELIFTRPETGDLVIKVRQQPRPDGNRPVPFKLQLRGDISLEHLRHFVSLDLRRQGQQLAVERFEVIGPVAERGNRGGRARKPGGDKGGPAKPKGHGRAVTRQGR
ncbi:MULTISPECIES: hypothetical protein [unclassified Cyanobium]|uniref:hypothetical protein n=1 Tax=unclassified Cyanobium TaxID=2627006 RepID=UPI0020CEBCE0|nr:MULTISPECIES: hypothetical protein [unclassified Cyanobium]MCP9858484.1 hypothetical protein [Cyanobium sp. Cruz-8H5]MCP9865432.1 hypothetical protein [Cyanobium sp. Cruz-8D1]